MKQKKQKIREKIYIVFDTSMYPPSTNSIVAVCGSRIQAKEVQKGNPHNFVIAKKRLHEGDLLK